MAADRGAFIDQSQSLNIHIAEPNYGKLTSMHFYAWSLVIYMPILCKHGKLWPSTQLEFLAVSSFFSSFDITMIQFAGFSIIGKR